MPEATPAAPAADAATKAEAPTPAATDTEAPLGVAGQKALAAEREARAAAEKAAKELQARLDAIESEKLSDVERARKEAQAAQEAAAKATAEALRYRYAAKYGISDEDAETFLTGSDEATIAAQAERLKELTAPKAPASGEVKPRLATDPSQGGGGVPPALNSDELEEALKRKLGIPV